MLENKWKDHLLRKKRNQVTKWRSPLDLQLGSMMEALNTMKKFLSLKRNKRKKRKNRKKYHLNRRRKRKKINPKKRLKPTKPQEQNSLKNMGMKKKNKRKLLKGKITPKTM